MSEQETNSKYPFYNKEEDYGYASDMTPEINWSVIINIEFPEGRFLNDDELWELFVLSHRLTPENIELMKEWDRDNNQPDRFTPYHNGDRDQKNLDRANAYNGGKEDKVFVFHYLTGEHSEIDLDFRNFKKMMYQRYIKNGEMKHR